MGPSIGAWVEKNIGNDVSRFNAWLGPKQKCVGDDTAWPVCIYQAWRHGTVSESNPYEISEGVFREPPPAKKCIEKSNVIGAAFSEGQRPLPPVFNVEAGETNHCANSGKRPRQHCTQGGWGGERNDLRKQLIALECQYSITWRSKNKINIEVDSKVNNLYQLPRGRYSSNVNTTLDDAHQKQNQHWNHHRVDHSISIGTDPFWKCTIELINPISREWKRYLFLAGVCQFEPL